MRGDGEVRGVPRKIKRAWKTQEEIRKRNMKLGLIKPKRKIRD